MQRMYNESNKERSFTMDRETRNLEYKEEITKSFLKTVSAFSNFGTGRIWSNR